MMTNWIFRGVLLAIGIMFCIAPGANGSTPLEPAKSVLFFADRVTFGERQDVIILDGNVKAEYKGRVLHADRLVYSRDTKTIHAAGNVEIIDIDGTRRFASELETKEDLLDGYAVAFTTRQADGATATAASAIRHENGDTTLNRAKYTLCELCDGDQTPTWALKARRAVIDKSRQMVFYRDAVLEIAGLPVIWLPYFAHPDPNSERRSGLLAPDFGLDSSYGSFYQQPYYWAISPYQDLAVTARIMRKVNPLLGFDYRKRFWSGALAADFSLTHERNFNSEGKKLGEKEWRGHLFANGMFEITDNWKWGFGIENMSDDLYTRRYNIPGARVRRGLYDSQPLQLLNQFFVQGQDSNWYADFALLSFDSLRAGDDEKALPDILPLLYAQRLFDFGDGGIASITGSGVSLNRKAGRNSYRASIDLDWRANHVLPLGFLLAPFAEGRYDHYRVSRPQAIPGGVGSLPNLPPRATPNDTGDQNINRGFVNAGALLSYPLHRPGKTVDLLIKPTVMLVYGTQGVNDPDIPVEDSLLYEFDEMALFTANGIGGYDLNEGGSKIAVGLSATARWKNGFTVTALGGRRWRRDTDAGFFSFTGLDGFNKTGSDWVGGLSASFGAPLQVDMRMRLAHDNMSLNRFDARLRTDWWRFNGQIRYYKINGDITATGNDDEGIRINGQFRLLNRFYFAYGLNRDISGRTNAQGRQLPGRNLQHRFGLAYEDDCARFELALTQSELVDRTIGPREAITFSFVLKTLGQFGSRDFQ